MVTTINMMAAQPLSVTYEETMHKTEGLEQMKFDPAVNFADTHIERICESSSNEHQIQMNDHKASIYRHPLFPLLVLLLEKCEQSTQTSDCVKSTSIDCEITNFVYSLEKEGKTVFSEDCELDHLMIKATQVLRIHLLELEKVSDLCKDFCSRYISCLKNKINNETLLSGDSDDASSPIQSQAFSPFLETMNLDGTVSTSTMQQSNNSGSAVIQPHGVSGNNIYQPVTAVNVGHLVSQAVSPSSMHMQNSQQLNQGFSFHSTDDGSSKNKRGVLPKSATNIMRTWLFQHITHPYPSEDEKKQISIQTNLTLLQVNNWFINARRRILPMLDTSLTETGKAKKKTPQNRPQQRFWPDSITSPVSQEELETEDAGMVTVRMGVDGFHTLSSDEATHAMQEVMMRNDSEDGTDDSGEEDTYPPLT